MKEERKPWRPPSWKNPHKDYWGKEMTLKEDYETNQHFSYEAGADAMLSGILRDLLERRIKVRRRGECVELIPAEE